MKWEKEIVIYNDYDSEKNFFLGCAEIIFHLFCISVGNGI